MLFVFFAFFVLVVAYNWVPTGDWSTCSCDSPSIQCSLFVCESTQGHIMNSSNCANTPPIIARSCNINVNDSSNSNSVCSPNKCYDPRSDGNSTSTNIGVNGNNEDFGNSSIIGGCGSSNSCSICTSHAPYCIWCTSMSSCQSFGSSSLNLCPSNSTMLATATQCVDAQTNVIYITSSTDFNSSNSRCNYWCIIIICIIVSVAISACISCYCFYYRRRDNYIMQDNSQRVIVLTEQNYHNKEAATGAAAASAVTGQLSRIKEGDAEDEKSTHVALSAPPSSHALNIAAQAAFLPSSSDETGAAPAATPKQLRQQALIDEENGLINANNNNKDDTSYFLSSSPSPEPPARTSYIPVTVKRSDSHLIKVNSRPNSASINNKNNNKPNNPSSSASSSSSSSFFFSPFPFLFYFYFICSLIVYS